MTPSNIIAHLIAQPDIFAVTATRVYPHGRLPQAATGQITANMPALTVNPLFVSSHKTTSEKGCFEQWRVQIDCWSTQPAEATQLRRTIATLLDGYRGDFGGCTASYVSRNAEPPVFYDDDKNLWLAVSDYSIHTI